MKLIGKPVAAETAAAVAAATAAILFVVVVEVFILLVWSLSDVCEWEWVCECESGACEWACVCDDNACECTNGNGCVMDADDVVIEAGVETFCNWDCCVTSDDMSHCTCCKENKPRLEHLTHKGYSLKLPIRSNMI